MTKQKLIKHLAQYPEISKDLAKKFINWAYTQKDKGFYTTEASCIVAKFFNYLHHPYGGSHYVTDTRVISQYGILRTNLPEDLNQAIGEKLEALDSWNAVAYTGKDFIKALKDYLTEQEKQKEN